MTSGPTAAYEEVSAFVVQTYPHATDAFTEGLAYEGGQLYESTGLEGRSSLRRIDLVTGQSDLRVSLPADIFAEGLAIVGAELVQLSWRNGRAFVWDRDSLAPRRDFRYEGEGWGLCHDGVHLVMSDGTDVLQLRDAATFDVVRRVAVRRLGVPLDRLNELECVGDDVFANVWGLRHIARIHMPTGDVTQWIDTAGLLEHADPTADLSGIDVLNGIAYLPERSHLLLTGKLWPNLFEVELRSSSVGQTSDSAGLQSRGAFRRGFE
jgi:glutamine cyclotransferase